MIFLSWKPLLNHRARLVLSWFHGLFWRLPDVEDNGFETCFCRSSNLRLALLRRFRFSIVLELCCRIPTAVMVLFGAFGVMIVPATHINDNSWKTAGNLLSKATWPRTDLHFSSRWFQMIRFGHLRQLLARWYRLIPSPKYFWECLLERYLDSVEIWVSCGYR